MAANKDMYLWWGSGSAPCWKVMIALDEKGLWSGCPNKLCSFAQKEHKSEEIMKLNSRGQVPTFKDGDTVVNDSGAAMVYIEEKYSTDANRLLPLTDAKARSEVFQKIFETQNLPTNGILPVMYYKMRTKKEDWDQQKIDEGLVQTRTELAVWNKELEGKDYLCGDKFTLADVGFYPWVAYMVRCGAKFTDYPNLKKYYDNVTTRPSVQNTWPPHWKEGPGQDLVPML